MRQDTPREQLPKGQCWDMLDMIPELGAPARKRGGWTRPWAAASQTAASYVASVGFAPFSAGSVVLFTDEDGYLYKASSSASTITAVGSAFVPLAKPTFYRDKAYFCDPTGAADPKSYDGTTLTSITASAPSGALATTYKDHLVLARSSSNSNRVWFSNAGDPASWDTAADGQWLDVDTPIMGIVSTRNMMMAFQEGKTQRIRGDIIPGVANSDMVVEHMFSVGCSDPASIAVTDDYVVFANSAGVYLTDGIGVASLTLQGGIDQYWRSLMASYSSSWTIAGESYRDRYICSIMDGSTFKDALMVDVKKRVWSRLSNVKSPMMVATPVGIYDAPNSLYSADRASKYVMDLSPMWVPAAANKADGDGTAVTWSLETMHYLGRPGKKRWKSIYPKYHCADAASDNPTVAVTYQTNLTASSYSSLATLSETSSASRVRVPLRIQRTEGVHFKLSQTNASSDTRLFSLEAEVVEGERSRL